VEIGMIVFGLTGGVGMGKSAAAQFLCERGAQIVDTDEVARRLVQPGQPALAEIQNIFGDSIVASNGVLCRDKLADIVFSDSIARGKLEAILHPRIREHWHAQLENWRNGNQSLAVVVIPLLFETRSESLFDKIICVACLPTTQFKRLSERGWSPTNVQRRIAAQWSVQEKMNRSNFVVWTEGELEAHADQVARILTSL
jgi:dephospho-CoA kinase